MTGMEILSYGMEHQRQVGIGSSTTLLPPIVLFQIQLQQTQ